ncbi:hypothetical protein ARALYDRAFT_898704 [Arabidopsis lyrata subsp. lyrata]|uniref:F-box domain-containing protein n=1 Tax=Arabidopsis lyrata subsp. lyrata TaxID=81972 RepID=D7L1N7_ARALL|nr:hypothetical protein ARALYDRAFT_898704 [Arabidopsis lyrata subsp. lyrata]
MMMSDLPRDLVEEILSRIPATSVKRLRSTCKLWNTLFNNRKFTEKNFRKAPKESMVLMLKECRVRSMSVNLNVAPPSLEFKGALGLKDSHSNTEQVNITKVSHCDGLLLCTTGDDRLVVWNPCLGETRWIQHKTGYERYSRFSLGYENNKSCRSYKILGCWDRIYDYKLNGRGLRFEIYDINSDSWKVLDDLAHDLILPVNCVSLKGNTYWFGSFVNNLLLSFDFTTERIKHFCLPPSRDHGCIALSVVGEERLSVLQPIERSKMEIFVTNKVDSEAALLWSKSFTVDLPIGLSFPEVFASLLIDEEKKVALCCNLALKTGRNLVYTIGEDSEYYSEIPYVESTNEPWWIAAEDKPCWLPFIFSYVPSLVQIL